MTVVRMQLLSPDNAAAQAVIGAICFDRERSVIFGRQITEPDVLAQFEGRSFAYFEMEEGPNHNWKIVRRVADELW